MRAAPLLLLVVACGGSGLGGAVRKDVTSQMESAQPDLSACYKTALEVKRSLAGKLVLAFDVEAKTGKFTKVRVVRDPIGNDALAACVMERVGQLKLGKPQSTHLAVDSYPIEFAPSE